ncbi:MAG: SufD family Fe-S cluster assembly protein, partial [Acidimicrobiales bacterium]
MALPTESEEVWRYSGIDGFDLDAFEPAPSPAAARDGGSDLALGKELAAPFGERCALVVTRDGSVSAVELLPSLPEGALELSSARGRSDEPAAPPGLGELGRARDAFGALHDAFMSDAVLIDVRPKAVIGQPVVVVHLVSTAGVATGGEGDAARAPSCFPRTRVRLGRSSQAGVIELLASADTVPRGSQPGASLVVPITEMDLADDAHLAYANVQVLGRGSTQIALQASRVGTDGVLRSLTAALGGGYARVRTDSDLHGQGAESSLLAAYLGTGSQVHDFRTLQDHHGRRTRSELLFKGAVADEAHSVYSALIRIARG